MNLRDYLDEQGVQYNFQDTGHWWVAIGHQTGRISVTEVAAYYRRRAQA